MADLQRVVRLLLWGGLGLALGGSASLAFADTVPSIQQQGTPSLYWNDYSQSGTHYTSTSFSSECGIDVPLVYGSGYSGVVVSNICEVQRNTDHVNITSNALGYQWRCSITNQAISSGNSATSALTQPTFTCGSGTTCPSTTWGGSYALDPGGATCSRPDPCPAGASASSSGFLDYGTSAGGSIGIGCAANGCLVSFVGTSPAGTALVSGITHYYASGSWQNIGNQTSTCTGGSIASAGTPAAAVPASTCASGQDSAVMGGVVKCFDPTTGQPAQTQAPTTSTTQNTSNTDPGTGNTTTTSTTTNGDGSKSVTVTVTTSAGQVVSSQTSTTPAPTGTAATTPQQQQQQQDFCTTNPTAAVCQTHTASGGGDCTGPPTCSGDPIECEVAQQTWATKCALTYAPDATSNLGQAVIAGNDPAAGTYSQAALTSTVAVDAAFNQSASQRDLTGACPAPVSFTVMGHTYSIDLSGVCNSMTIAGNIVVALALLIAVRIIGTGL